MGNPRPKGPMQYLATLVRGRTYSFSYAPKSLDIERGKATAINQVEFDKLSQQHEVVTYHDGDQTMMRSLPVWKFTSLDGTPVEVEVPADEVVRQA